VRKRRIGRDIRRGISGTAAPDRNRSDEPDGCPTRPTIRLRKAAAYKKPGGFRRALTTVFSRFNIPEKANPSVGYHQIIP